MPNIRNIKISSILIDDHTHPRDTIDRDLVMEYATAMRADAKFPPIVLYHDGKKYYLADGRHRIEANKLISRDSVAAEVISGSSRDAILHAVGANDAHGIRRSNADKRKAVKILLADKEWRQWSHNKIALQCRVSDGLVTAVYKDVQEELHLPKLEDTADRKVERGGKVFKQKTAKRARIKDSDTSSARPLYSIITIASDVREKLAAEKQPQLIKRIDKVREELEDILGKATGAAYRLTKGLNQPLNVYEKPRPGGIEPTPAFEKKKLCNYSVRVGMACGHQCTYCSSPSLFRPNEVFADIHQTAFQKGYAIVDPNTAKRVSESIPQMSPSDVIQLCTTDDAWSPEARKYNIGRDTMKVLLEKTPAQIRVLTKSAEVSRDYDLFASYKDRIMIGLSVGIPSSYGKIAEIIEPNGSSIKDRLAALNKARKLGLRVYGMFCPCLPIIASTEDKLSEMFDSLIELDAENYWLEPVNRRGDALPYTEQQLRRAGYKLEADAVGSIRSKAGWSLYALGLIQNAIKVAGQKKVLDRLNILLYTSDLQEEHAKILKEYKKGIVWLEDGNTDESSASG